MAKVLVVDDDLIALEGALALLERMGYDTYPATTVAQGVSVARQEQPAAALVDIHLPDGSGYDALESIRNGSPQTALILVSGDLEVDTATRAYSVGAFEFLTKPFTYQSMEKTLGEALREGATALKRGRGVIASRRLMGYSPEICRANMLIERYAKTPDTNIMIMGESGTGKELCASAIHLLSERAEGPFIKINCPAIPASLIESEIFGFEKGSFTDAKVSRPGVFEQANGGTLFLDEIGELSLDLQPKLLRVLEENVVTRIGSRNPKPINVRVVCATNRNLPEYCQQGRFREDLYFRLACLQLKLPPLHGRREDISLLAEHFLRQVSQSVGRYFTSISNEVLSFLEEYPWPGNVRELKNFIERLVILSPSQGELKMSRKELLEHTFLPFKMAEVPRTDETTPQPPQDIPRPHTDGSQDWKDDTSGRTYLEEVIKLLGTKDLPTLASLEMTYIKYILSICEGNKTSAADILGVARSTLIRKLDRQAESTIDVKRADLS